MRNSFAYVINQRLPNEFALSIYIVKTCEAVKKLGHKTSLLAPQRTQPTHFPYDDIWDYYGLPKNYFELVKFKAVELLKIPYWLERIVVHLRYQFITWTFSIQALLYLVKHDISIIQTVSREMIFLLRLAFWYRPLVIYDVHIEPKTWYESLFDYLIIPRVNLFLVNCQYYKRYYFNKGVDPSKILILPSGFDPNQFSLGKGSFSSRLRQKLKLPQKKFIIGYIGRFEIFGIEKGVRAMLKAVSSLKDRLPIALVAVGGPDKFVKKYQKMARKLGLSANEAIIRPQVKPNKVAQYIACFDIACMLYPNVDHYRNKMSPMKAMEYMATSKPIIATDLPAIKQLLSNKRAYLIKPGKQKVFEQTILKIWKNPRKAKLKAKRARQFIQQFSWVNRHKKVLKSLERDHSAYK